MTQYRLQLVQQFKDTVKPARYEFCIDMLKKLEDNGFEEWLIFSDEETIYVSDKVKKQNTRIWSTGSPQ